MCIRDRSVSASVESISLPGEELLAHLEYRNLSSLYLKIVKLPESSKRWRGDTWDGEEVLRKLNQLSSRKDWKQTFDSGNDHQQHNTEIALPALPVGHYALLVSDHDNFDNNTATTGTVMFTVSELAYWYLDDTEQGEVAAVVNRSSGLPIEGVKVEFISFEYNAGLRKQEELKLGQAISDASGWVKIPAHDNKSISLWLTKGEDDLYAVSYTHLTLPTGDLV